MHMGGPPKTRNSAIILEWPGLALFSLNGSPGHRWALRLIVLPLRPEMGPIMPDLGPLSIYVNSFRAKNGPWYECTPQGQTYYFIVEFGPFKKIMGKMKSFWYLEGYLRSPETSPCPGPILATSIYTHRLPQIISEHADNVTYSEPCSRQRAAFKNGPATGGAASPPAAWIRPTQDSVSHRSALG